MLNHNSSSRLGYFIVIGFLVCFAMFLCYKVGSHEGDMRAIRIDKNFTAGENEALKGREKKYIEALQYYQGVLSKAYTLTKDMTLALKEGTLVIPPVQQQGQDT